MPDRNITFEIREHLGTIAKYDTNWRKELNIVSWNGGTPKYDIRDWDDHHVKMSKGITLTNWEMRKVVELYFACNTDRAVVRGRALEEERNALRAAPYRRKDALELDDTSEDVPFDVEEPSEKVEAFAEPTESTVEEQVTTDAEEAGEKEEEPF